MGSVSCTGEGLPGTLPSPSIWGMMGVCSVVAELSGTCGGFCRKGQGWPLHVHLPLAAETMSLAFLDRGPLVDASSPGPRGSEVTETQAYSPWRWQILLAHGVKVQVVQPLTTWVTLNMILHPLEGWGQHLSAPEGWQQGVLMAESVWARKAKGMDALQAHGDGGQNTPGVVLSSTVWVSGLKLRLSAPQPSPTKPSMDSPHKAFSDRILMEPTQENQ